jgi:DNA-binding GntR family transcriptional regulator
VRQEQRREKGFEFSSSQCMAARLITANATDEEVARLRTLFATMEDNTRRADIDEYSDLHIGFHQAIIALSTSQWLATMTESLLIHLCAMRARTIGEHDRTQRSWGLSVQRTCTRRILARSRTRRTCLP